MFNYGDGSQKGPAQRLTDFAKGRMSKDLPDSSYIPGLYPAPLHQLLPKGIYSRLAHGVQVFGEKMGDIAQRKYQALNEVNNVYSRKQGCSAVEQYE